MTGPAKILGVGNGDPSSHEPDKASSRSVFNGLAQVLVQSASEPGPIALTATSPGLESASVPLTASDQLATAMSPRGGAVVRITKGASR